jgi:hypothetical protein
VDTHLVHRTTDALWTTLWRRAAELGIRLLAGSCLPLAWRSPWLE